MSKYEDRIESKIDDIAEKLKKLDIDHIVVDDNVPLSGVINPDNPFVAMHNDRPVTIEKIDKKNLENTVPLMISDDYKDRFKAEYLQLKIRYEKLNDLCTRIEAYERAQMESMPLPECPKHTCSWSLLHDQLMIMESYKHILEIRAKIEGVDLNW